RLLHVVGPDLHREGSAGDLSASAVGADRHFLAVDLAVEDDGGREIRGVAGEPGGLVLVRGAGLARCRAAEILRVAARTAVDDLLQRVRGLGGHGLVEDALALGIGLYTSSSSAPWVIFLIEWVSWWTPFEAKVAYAVAISMGFTLAVPSTFD